MAYTILSAQWGNDEHTSAVIITAEVGACAISLTDTPLEWANLLTWGQTNTITSLPVVVFTPKSVTKVQFLRRLIVLNKVTAAEVLALLRTGVMPSAFSTFLLSLTVGQRVAAEIFLLGMDEVSRQNLTIRALCNSMSLTDDDIDDLFRQSAQL